MPPARSEYRMDSCRRSGYISGTESESACSMAAFFSAMYAAKSTSEASTAAAGAAAAARTVRAAPRRAETVALCAGAPRAIAPGVVTQESACIFFEAVERAAGFWRLFSREAERRCSRAFGGSAAGSVSRGTNET